MKSIPVTIITGYLGAGKTCLLNRFMGENAEKRFALIENEFGEIGIDSKLIVADRSVQIYELSSGCICCEKQDELLETLHVLHNTHLVYDHLLIESTGIADPGSIVTSFLKDDVAGMYHIDSVVCLVDALNFSSVLEKYFEAYRQVAFADIVVLNKVDLVSEEELRGLERKLKSINPKPEILRSQFAMVDTRQLLDRQLWSEHAIADFTVDFFAQHNHSTKQGGKHGMSSHGFCFDRPFSMERFTEWLPYFLSVNTGLFRAKGIVYVQGVAYKFVFQSVGANYQLQQGDLWGFKEQRESKLVFIGSQVDPIALSEGLRQLLY